jgi:hypothetical protein
MTEKLPRGRPLGSGKDDADLLGRTAAILLSNAKMKPTTAMRQVLLEKASRPETDATTIRRLQVKWKIDGDGYMAAERQRATRAAEIANAPRSHAHGLAFASDVGHNLRSDLSRELEREALIQSEVIKEFARQQTAQLKLGVMLSFDHSLRDSKLQKIQRESEIYLQELRARKTICAMLPLDQLRTMIRNLSFNRDVRVLVDFAI